MKDFKRELGVDDHRAVVAGQFHDAVGARAVRQRRLECERAYRQAVAHDGLHAPLSIGAARLLVGQDVLEAHHFLRERGEVGLGAVDHGQALAEARELVGGGARALFEALAHAGAHGVETIGDDFAHRPQTSGQFGVHARKVGHAVIEFALAFGRRESLEAARIRRAHDGYENSAQQKQTEGRSREGRVGERDLRASQSEENVRHGASLRDSPAGRERIMNRFAGLVNEPPVPWRSRPSRRRAGRRPVPAGARR